jgi:hypothetical protein
MQVLKKFALLGASVLALAACGGGGGGDSPPAPKLITANNYLDPAWGAMIAGIRMEVIAGIIDRVFRYAIDSEDTPGVYTCDKAGSISFTKTGNAREFTLNNCIMTLPSFGDVRFLSGSVSSPNATDVVAGNAVLLNSGEFVLSSLNTDWGAGPEIYLGNVAVARQADLRIAATGTVTVNRNGRNDQYTNVALRSSLPAADNSVSMESGAFNLNSPRIAFSLAAAFDASSIRATAADNSAVRVADPNSAASTLRYEVFASYSAGAAPDTSRALANNDPAVVAAVQRLLQ